MTPLTLPEALARLEQLFRAGQCAEMQQLCAAILEVAPQTSEAHRFLSLAACVVGDWPLAENHVRQAIAIAPRDPIAHDNLSVYLLRQGRSFEAEEAARDAIGFNPNVASAWHNLALALSVQRRRDEAEAALRHALQLDPNNSMGFNDLASILCDLGRIAEAEQCLHQALRLAPDFALAQENLARLQSLPVSRESAASLNNQGVELLALGRFREAEQLFRRALPLDPQLPELYFNLARARQGQGDFAEAESHYRQAATLRPEWDKAHFAIGDACFHRHHLADAEVALRQGLRLNPQHAQGWSELGNLLNVQGRLEDSLVVLRQGLALNPDHASSHSILLLTTQYAPDVSLESLAQSHADWDQQHGQPLRSTWRGFANSRQPQRQLRLGFVSGDFSCHPVGFFLAPVLERLPRHDCLTVCYSNHGKVDSQTERLRSAANLWRDVVTLGDEPLAELIRADQIDLLFDLSGHTGHNRLLTFARRAAPVQLTWAGYVGTTGLAAMDYLIADRYHIPPGWEEFYREKVIRLPEGYLCYEPPSYAPEVGPLPALAAGHVTFGCFNNTAKINAQVIAVWAEILRQVAGSRLVLKYHWLNDASVRRRLLERFIAAGVDPQRLDLLGSSVHVQHLAQLERLDLALDPFPYAGGLSACEACWMGVPVVCWPGKTFASRHSLSHLSNIGLLETIAESSADYVARAVSLAQDLPRLSEIRGSLRQQMAKSSLCDGERFTRDFVTALRDVWGRWCEEL
jgi:predicted O-linked N-acetylglucosamine transferase (SPINDLY family)